MSISRQNLTVVIVSFMSDNVIHDCIKSIPEDIKIIVIDNSNNKLFKDRIEKQYDNITCLLSSENLGMGSGNNLGLKEVSTEFAFILNPDTILKKNTIDEIIKASNNLPSFSIIAPILDDDKFPNYKLSEKKETPPNYIDPYKVKSVDGFAMILNLKRINSLNTFENYQYFDENFFLYLENDDLCKRINENNENIYIVPKAKIKHLGAGAVDKKYAYEIELTRNWHWLWSKFYFNKKHYGFFKSLIKSLPTFFSAISKYIFYSPFDKKKKEIYLYRALGFLNAVLGKKSYLRPKIKISDQENR
tara:strand:- start:888 stop:1796 length:909 start_codon:yes stop_codon:yes gene_type:complete